MSAVIESMRKKYDRIVNGLYKYDYSLYNSGKFIEKKGICIYCGKEYTFLVSGKNVLMERIKNSRYCSHRCQALDLQEKYHRSRKITNEKKRIEKTRKRKVVKCANAFCDNTFVVPNKIGYSRKYCSSECFYYARTKEYKERVKESVITEELKLKNKIIR